MVSRKISFFVVCTCTLIPVLYTSRIFPAPLLFACAGIVSAGLGMTLFVQTSSIRVKQAGFFLITCFLGISLGLSLSVRLQLQRASAFTGLETSRITSYTGTCTKDSLPAEKGGYITIIQLTRVHSDILGASADARGRVMCMSEGSARFYTGEKVVINTGLSPVHFSPDIHFISYPREGEILPSGYSCFLFHLRQELHQGLESLIETMGFPASALFKALFLGIQEDLSGNVYEGFEKTGTLHILALSGLHAGIIFTFAGFFLFFFPGKWIKYIAGFCIILFYLFIVGPRPSLVRAAIMIIIIGIGYLLALERELLNLLAIAGFLILIVDPASAFSLSFQLSFLALAGIFLVSPRFTSLLRQYLPRWIALPLACSIGAQFMTAPVVFLRFGTVYPSGILVTLVLLPFVTVFLWGGLIFLLLSGIHFPFIREIGEYFFSFLYTVIIRISSFFKHMPGITIDWKWWHWLLFLLCLLLFLFPPGIIYKGMMGKNLPFTMSIMGIKNRCSSIKTKHGRLKKNEL
jgi:ComEC/Rec2-related protein